MGDYLAGNPSVIGQLSAVNIYVGCTLVLGGLLKGKFVCFGGNFKSPPGHLAVKSSTAVSNTHSSLSFVKTNKTICGVRG